MDVLCVLAEVIVFARQYLKPKMKSVHLIFVVLIVLFTSCKKQEQTSIDFDCISQFDNEIDLHLKFNVGEITERAFVYRSTDNKFFGFVGEVNLDTLQNNVATFKDATSSYNTMYYYKVTYGTYISKTVQVKADDAIAAIFIPQIVKDNIKIICNYSCASYNIAVYDLLGRAQFTKQDVLGNQTISASSLADGAYVIVLTIEGRTIEKKIVVAH
jgi:hypothetical protein